MIPKKRTSPNGTSNPRSEIIIPERNENSAIVKKMVGVQAKKPVIILYVFVINWVQVYCPQYHNLRNFSSTDIV